MNFSLSQNAMTTNLWCRVTKRHKRLKLLNNISMMLHRAFRSRLDVAWTSRWLTLNHPDSSLADDTRVWSFSDRRKEEWQFSYSDVERQAIIAAVPSPVPDGVDVDAVIRELEDAASVYIGVGDAYRQRRDKAPAWKKALKLIDDLIAHAEQERLEAVLPDLEGARDRERPFVLGAEMSAHSHRGRGSPETKQLYDQARASWRRLGGKFKVSRFRGDTPQGPAIRFFEAVLRPVMKEDAQGWRASSRSSSRAARNRTFISESNLKLPLRQGECA
jgi:hypothetical protein